MAQLKRNEAKHNKPKCRAKPNPLRHAPMSKRLPEKSQVASSNSSENVEDELLMHLNAIKNAYSKNQDRATRRRAGNQKSTDLFKSKVYNVVSAALECGCVHDVLQKQGNYYCLRSRCVLHTNPGAPRYCQNCCKMHSIVKGPRHGDFQAARPCGFDNGPKIQVLHCPECRALERARK